MVYWNDSKPGYLAIMKQGYNENLGIYVRCLQFFEGGSFGRQAYLDVGGKRFLICYTSEAHACNEWRTGGECYTYRIGGDEYVAFALDCTKEEVEQKIHEVRAAVEKAGYHVSIGFEYMNAGELQLHELISRAEANMYHDKAEYYKGHDRSRRV